MKDTCEPFDSITDEQTKLFLIREEIDHRLKDRITMMNPLTLDELVFAPRVAKEGRKQAYEAEKENKNDDDLMKMLEIEAETVFSKTHDFWYEWAKSLK